jgi:hypothetical protein
LAPEAIEIGDQWLDPFGTQQRLRLLDIGKLVERVVDSGIAAAPAPPTPLRRKGGDREGQMVARIPVIEDARSASAGTSARTTK